jgi:16S rRNA (guanine527-N7)-methyltransferase
MTPDGEGLEGRLPEESAAAARLLFGDRLPVAARYAGLLATDGVIRGLIGPREAPRIWQRHLLNCAAMAGLVPSGATVTDVGSGAGLPGIVLAVARPDLTMTLVEPMARRTTFLAEAVAALDLSDRVTIVRCRADEAVGRVPAADVVTARALAPLDRLVAWCLPLVRVGGRVLAIKGASAGAEIAAHRRRVAALGGGTPVVHRCGVGVLDQPTSVVEVIRERVVPRSRRSAAAG